MLLRNMHQRNLAAGLFAGVPTTFLGFLDGVQVLPVLKRNHKARRKQLKEPNSSSRETSTWPASFSGTIFQFKIHHGHLNIDIIIFCAVWPHNIGWNDVWRKYMSNQVLFSPRSFCSEQLRDSIHSDMAPRHVFKINGDSACAWSQAWGLRVSASSFLKWCATKSHFIRKKKLLQQFELLRVGSCCCIVFFHHFWRKS